MTLTSLPLLAPCITYDRLPPHGERSAIIVEVARIVSRRLEKLRPFSPQFLRDTMTQAFGASDAAGGWSWKDAYDAAEAAQVLCVLRSAQMGPAAPAAELDRLRSIAGLLPSQTRRAERTRRMQQFSTPLPYAYVVAQAAALTAADTVLEPSAGTGLLAAFAARAGARLILNEIDEIRAGILCALFPQAPITGHNGEHICDYLDGADPSVVLINPPFTASPNRESLNRHAGASHLRSALLGLRPGGRLVAVTLASFEPAARAWSETWEELGRIATLRLSISLPGGVYAAHGTTVETRLSVFDKPASAASGCSAPVITAASDLDQALAILTRDLPDRIDAPAVPAAPAPVRSIVVNIPRPRPATPAGSADLMVTTDAEPLDYEIIDATEPAGGNDDLYQAHVLQRIRIPGAAEHPTPLVQSAALASVCPPAPCYRPMLPPRLVRDGILSAAQLETVVYAGQAHDGYLNGAFLVDESLDHVRLAADGDAGTVRFRRGYFLGDGTGAGKGRQVAAVILDHWLRGRRKAVWVSASDKLIEDARRDWMALGGDGRDLHPLSRWRQGVPITLGHGIVFVTYATLRVCERRGKPSRLKQIVDWLGAGFDGVLVFDESHAMANAAGENSGRGERKPSEQGRAGLRLQNALPDARVLYVSATGATQLKNLAYAARLGLWGTEDFPFATRAAFIAAMEQGGVAAMEMVCRDLKALGLYTSRALSFHGVEYDILEHPLTSAQIEIYDAYAGAFAIIHNNLQAALEKTNIVGREGVYNRGAKSAAMSAFESAKQRFFNHLLTAMKCRTLIPAIEQDLADGHAVVVQLVSTGEALIDRRLAEIPPADWNDLNIDATPRDLVLTYLANSFPTQLHEVHQDGETLYSLPAFTAEGDIVHSREAVELREKAIERLGALPAVHGALDQIVQHFGHDAVAEITGRSRRIIRTRNGGTSRLVVDHRPAAANLVEAQAFMDDRKRVLVFSQAGGTGRSYHADLGAANQRRRIHYLVEPGWRADVAIQGLGRSHRTNQAQPPLFRPVTTDVKGEKRFTSTIARRLDTLGALTRGQRQTGGQGLFRAEDNLESRYAKAALQEFFRRLHRGQLASCSLQAFCAQTGLKLTDKDGSLLEQLPPIHQFLNRILALPIATQNAICADFEHLIALRVEHEIAAGTYEQGIETIRAESLVVADRRVVHTHPKTGAETTAIRVRRRTRNRPLTLADLAERHGQRTAGRVVNRHSGRAALAMPTSSLMAEDGSVIARVRLIRPLDSHVLNEREFAASHWQDAASEVWADAWTRELDAIPEFTDDEIILITGLLLPLWTHLPAERMRVYRLRTDGGEALLGRLVAAEQLRGLCTALGVAGAPAASPEELWRDVIDENSVLDLAGGARLKRVTVAGDQRCELIDYRHTDLDTLKHVGCFTEIIAWRTRVFVPVSDDGPAILGRVLDLYPASTT